MTREAKRRAEIASEMRWTEPPPPKPLNLMNADEVDTWLESWEPSRQRSIDAAIAGGREERDELDQAVAWLARLRPEVRRSQRIYFVHCGSSARCTLIEMFPRRGARDGSSDERILLATRTKTSLRYDFADSRDSEYSGRQLPFACTHGYGAWPTIYPSFVRREGPSPRRRITDIARDESVIQTFLMFNYVLWTPAS